MGEILTSGLENESVLFKCWKELSASVLAEVDQIKRMKDHIANTFLGLSFFPSVSSFEHFQCFMEMKKAQLIAKVTENILDKFVFFLEKKTFQFKYSFLLSTFVLKDFLYRFYRAEN